IDGRHVGRADPPSQHSGQSSGSTPHVEQALTGTGAGGVGKRNTERGGIPPHEPVVLLSRRAEPHRGTEAKPRPRVKARVWIVPRAGAAPRPRAAAAKYGRRFQRLRELVGWAMRSRKAW